MSPAQKNRPSHQVGKGTRTRTSASLTENSSPSERSFGKEGEVQGQGLGIEPERVRVCGPDGNRTRIGAEADPRVKSPMLYLSSLHLWN